MGSLDDRAKWQAYEAFKKALPPELDWRERERAIREYCDREGV